MNSNLNGNRALVLEAMTALFQRRDASVVEKLYAENYVQHNPAMPQGRDVLTELVAQLPPDLHYEPGLIVAEGAYVAVHGRIRGWAPKPQVVIDIFRIEDGRLAEHWDVLQDEVPPSDGKAGVAMFSPDESAIQAANNRALEAGDVDSVSVNYEDLMQANLVRVFSESDAQRRLAAIKDIYAADAVLHEPHGSVTGPEAINLAVSSLLKNLPAHFRFAASGPAVGHHGVARLRWQGVQPDGITTVTGTDVAQFQHGKIKTLFVFLDPSVSP
ncbi:nuclear transport factor 2 family protein [Acidovorax sp. Root219]|uniref:nuclear transport factor 2 family protein n=1 Tax=Acidovorax sp. Root219 TaxID=1736493 RepID=UPI000B187EF2|nr:nuclear transport factor 2 family protein [Acidovorax sp. Root219]